MSVRDPGPAKQRFDCRESNRRAKSEDYQVHISKRRPNAIRRLLKQSQASRPDLDLPAGGSSLLRPPGDEEYDQRFAKASPLSSPVLFISRTAASLASS